MKTKKNIIAYLIFAVFLCGMIYWQFFSAVNAKDKNVLFQIKTGSSVDEVSKDLKNKSLIRSAFAFKIIAKYKKLDKKILPGRYDIKIGESLGEILNTLTNAALVETSVTIPEGFSVFDIDERLSETGLILPGEFEILAGNMEGSLFPDTYFVYKNNFDPRDLISKMQKNFTKKIGADLLEAIKKQNRTLQEIITMASILEKEVKTDKDYPIVSGILWKRIEHKWPLQADAALLYGKKLKIITAKELSDDTNPYNTYKNKGLPPSPICNPGLTAILAAIYPQDSDYWFYLTDKEGSVHYAKTNEEHNENRQKYL